MVEARVAPTATLLRDGRVLLAGGDNPGGVRRSLEIFDPATGSFSPAGLLSSRRKDHAAARLPDGRVLLVGGSNGTATLASTDVFNPKDNTVSRGPDLLSGRSGASATTLLNGNVLVAGGSNGSTDLASAEVYDSAGNRFLPTAGALETARRGHLAFLLPHNNNVLIVGGASSGVALFSAELFAPWHDNFSTTGAMMEARLGAAGGALAEDGLLLVAGGSGLASAELYGFATVKTDKPDYAPGETVIVSSVMSIRSPVAFILDAPARLRDPRSPLNVMA